MTQIVRMTAADRLIDVQRVGRRRVCLRCAPDSCEGIERAGIGFVCDACGERYRGKGKWEVRDPLTGEWRTSFRGCTRTGSRSHEVRAPGV